MAADCGRAGDYMKLGISKKLQDNYSNYYEVGASEWRRLGAQGKVGNIRRLCAGIRHSVVIEIGAGDGAVLRQLSEQNFAVKYFAVEVSESGVRAIFQEKISHLVDCKVFDGYEIPYADNQFDLAILTHVLEHVEHPRALLYDVARVARFVFVEVPLEDTVRLPQDFAFDSVGHINNYSRRSFRRLIQSCGFVIREEIMSNPPLGTYIFKHGIRGRVAYYVKHILLLVWPSLASKIFTYHYSILFEKIA